MFLILFGVLGKISGVFLASASVHFVSSRISILNHLHPLVPNPVLGGVTTFLFSSVAVSGIRVLSYTSFTRRDRFVLASAFCFGFADLLVPGIFTHLFESSRVIRATAAHAGLQGLLDSVGIVLQTPCKRSRSFPPHVRFTDINQSAQF